MNRNNHALIMGTARDGTIEGLVDLSAFGSAATFKKLVSRTCADLKRRGLVVKIQKAKVAAQDKTKVFRPSSR